MKFTLLAIGKMRGPDAELCEEYLKRLKGVLTLRELTAPHAAGEVAALQKAIPPKAFAVLCDERGKDITSRELADKLTQWQARETVFIIGGADGVSDGIKKRADFMLSFGRKTWPHRLARVMLLEQIYRAMQINAGHPYHRD
ncbi:MAG: 23S rRNA (pseudouridine(1915)-N(3))-methyltransferase RlmH [Bdellovibrionales bacterium]